MTWESCLIRERKALRIEKLMSRDKTELEYLAIGIGIKGGTVIQNNVVRRKYF